MLLHDLLDHAPADATALTFGSRSWTYGSLATASRAVGAWLRESGVRRGDRVVISLPPSDVAVPVAYGCSRAGAVFVILHDQVRGTGLNHVLDDATPCLLITDDPAAAAAAAARGISVATSETVLAQTGGHHPDAPLDDDHPDAPLNVDPVCFIYTSGSTGLPKAVVSTHAQMVFAAQAIQSQLRYRADDVVYCPLPLSFDVGLYQLFLGALSGAQVRLGTSADAGPLLLRNLRDARATILPGVPSVADNLARMLARYGGTVPLRLMTNTGAAMPEETLTTLRSHLPDLRVQLMFGLTECKRVSINPPDEDLRRPGSCGRALPGTEVLVLDDDGQPLPPHHVGQIAVRGPNVMAGYWRRPELTAQRFPRRDGLFPELHTGDYGWLDDDGYLYFSGRRDDIYKSRGFRVSATEVEAAVRRLDGVSGAAVLPPSPARPEAVLYAVTSLAPHELLDRLRAEIEPYKVPPTCVVVDALPLNSNGKVDKVALAAR